MNKLYVLNTGRADSFVIEINEDNDKKIIVIDGGTRFYEGKNVLNDFLVGKNIKKIDLLILTHLHQDHFGGFSEIDKDIKIKEAILPVSGDVFTEEVINYDFEKNHFTEYIDFYNKLIYDNCKIGLTFDKYNQKQYNFGEYSFKCLYPINNEESVVFNSINNMNKNHINSEAFNYYFDEYRGKCNSESSIWSLEKAGMCEALFLGDSTLKVSDVALKNYNKGTRILKLSHHGIDKRYYNCEQIETLQPKSIIVTTEERFTKEFKEEFKKVKNNGEIEVVFSYKDKEFSYEI